MGPGRIDAGHLRYNEAIQQSFGKELLLNIVRMRYREPAEFVDIGGVAAQYSFEGSASVNGNLVDGVLDLQNLGLGASGTAAERPTITYAPLRGKQFELCVLAPVDVGTVWLLANKGWRVDRILRVSLRSMNFLDNATSAGGPTPSTKPEYEAFLQAAALLRELQKDHAAEFVVAQRDATRVLPIAPEKLDPAFVLNATEKGYKVERNGQTVALTKAETYSALIVHPAEVGSPRMQELVSLLGLEPGLAVYEFDVARHGRIAAAFGESALAQTGRDDVRRVSQELPPALPDPGLPAGAPQAAPAPLAPVQGNIALQSRSIYEMMYYLSQGVEVPPSHLRKGLVTQTRDEQGGVYDWNAMLGDLFRVHVSRWKPRDAYLAVPYRGHWYYVRDDDLETKSTLSLLHELFNLQVRGGAGTENLPVLTLGVGGR
jgi:hypothetical protein